MHCGKTGKKHKLAPGSVEDFPIPGISRHMKGTWGYWVDQDLTTSCFEFHQFQTSLHSVTRDLCLSWKYDLLKPRLNFIRSWGDDSGGNSACSTSWGSEFKLMSSTHVKGFIDWCEGQRLENCRVLLTTGLAPGTMSHRVSWEWGDGRTGYPKSSSGFYVHIHQTTHTHTHIYTHRHLTQTLSKNTHTLTQIYIHRDTQIQTYTSALSSYILPIR